MLVVFLIADKRKLLGVTQVVLAEKLAVSDKSVSKWERGICLPDVSKYQELCDVLGISLNELFASIENPDEAGLVFTFGDAAIFNYSLDESFKNVTYEIVKYNNGEITDTVTKKHRFRMADDRRI